MIIIASTAPRKGHTAENVLSRTSDYYWISLRLLNYQEEQKL